MLVISWTKLINERHQITKLTKARHIQDKTQ